MLNYKERTQMYNIANALLLATIKHIKDRKDLSVTERLDLFNQAERTSTEIFKARIESIWRKE